MERISDKKLEIDLGETPAPEGMDRPYERLSRGPEPGEPGMAGTLPPVGPRVKAVGGGRAAVARGGWERQPARGSFLTASEGERKVPAGSSDSLYISAVLFSIHPDYASDGLGSPCSVPTTYDLQERPPLLAERIRSR
jgi:hypothetical protein